MKIPSIYCASPLGFTETGRFFLYGEVIPSLQRLDCEIIDPWKLTDQNLMDEALALEPGEARSAALKKINTLIGKNNCLAIEGADLVFAILDGTDVDSGTAAEIGFASALGKPVIGYRNDFRRTGENEEVLVNLQVQYFIEKNGSLHRNLESAIDEIARFISFFRRQSHGTENS